MKILSSQKLRTAGAGIWSLAFAIALVSPSFAWGIFSLAALLCFWAEKREFSTRVALYRCHDILLYSPWRYLFLHAIWIGIVGGWKNALAVGMGLLVIGLPAHFLFSRIGLENTVLDLERLRWPFMAFAIASIAAAVTLFLPSPLIGPELLLYTSIGLPFLFWDLFSDKKLLPPSLAFCAILASTGALYWLRPRACLLTLSACFGLFFALVIYKKFRFWRSLFLASAVMAIFIVGLYFLRTSTTIISYSQFFILELDRQRDIIENSFRAAQASIFLGSGLGSSAIRSGLALRLLAEAGVVGLLFYVGFFAQLLWRLFRIRRSRTIVVSNVAFLSLLIYLAISRHYLTNPYGIAVWVWYAIWVVLSSSNMKSFQSR